LTDALRDMPENLKPLERWECFHLTFNRPGLYNGGFKLIITAQIRFGKDLAAVWIDYRKRIFGFLKKTRAINVVFFHSAPYVWLKLAVKVSQSDSYWSRFFPTALLKV
jgi:hypothetical protein